MVKWWGRVFQAEGTACVQMLRWGELGLLREGQWDWSECGVGEVGHRQGRIMRGLLDQSILNALGAIEGFR